MSERKKKQPLRHRSFDRMRSSEGDDSLVLLRAMKDMVKNIAAAMMNVTKERDAWLLTHVENNASTLIFLRIASVADADFSFKLTMIFPAPRHDRESAKPLRMFCAWHLRPPIFRMTR